MERCPNCGAPARAGARFCTTCGYRLPQAGGAAAGGERDAPASGAAGGTAPSPWSAAPTEPVGDGESPAAADVPSAGEERVDTVAGDRAAGADQVLASSWPAAASASPWTDQWAAPEQPAQPEHDLSTPVAEQEEASVAAPGWPDAATAEASEASVAAPGWPDAATAEASADQPEPQPEPPAGASGDDLPLAVRLGQPFTPSPEAAMPSAASPVETRPEVEGRIDPTARAYELIDELRALVPALAGNTPEVNLEAIAAELDAAIATTGDGEASEMAELRLAMLSARERPRDIDTVLDLSRRVDTVIALLDEHDRCVAAIGRAVAALRGGDREQSPGMTEASDAGQQ